MKENCIKSVKKNVVLSVLVQIISLIVSFVLNLIVPKRIPEIEYSFWQTYVLYASYVGVLHFGILDGLVLRYSQYDYDELDKPKVRSQFVWLLVIEFLFSIVTLVFSLIFLKDEIKIIFIYVAISIISKNVFTYTSYTFQITNRISKYAILIISQRLFYGITTVILLLCDIHNFSLYCAADIGGDIFGCIIGYFYNKELYFGKLVSIKESTIELFVNVSSGIMLLIANWSSMLLVGSAKLIIQWHWDNLLFGKISFSFSLTNLFLTFVNAISVVLFPSLKRMDKSQLPELYKKIRNVISPVLFIALFFYYPGCFILNIWLPKYNESLVYLGIIMPLIVFTSKVSLLTNNYLKAFREEKKMLLINVITVIIAIGCYVVSAYIFDNLTMLIIMIIFMIVMRSIVSEILVMKLLRIKMFKDIVIEVVITVLFIVSAKLPDFWVGWGMYTIVLGFYLWLCKDNIKGYFIQILRNGKGKLLLNKRKI